MSIFKNIFNSLRVLSGGTESDKTLKLLLQASVDPNSCVVCTSAKEVSRVKSIVSEHEWNIEIITARQFFAKEYPSTVKSFYFDDVDKILKGYAHPKKIKMITFNTDNVKCLTNEE